MHRDHPEAPAGTAEVLAVRIDADRVVRICAEERSEPGHERAIDIVREEDQFRSFLQDRADLRDGLLAQRNGARVAGIDDKERLDGGIEQLLQLCVVELETALLPHLHTDYLEVVILEVRHLEIRREDRRRERNRVPGVEQPVRLHRLEDVAHRSRATLDGVEVEPPFRPRRPAHRPLQVFVNDLLVVHQHPVRHRIVVADDRIDELVDKSIGIEPELRDGPWDQRAEELGTRKDLVLLQPGSQPVCDTARPGHAADTGRKIEHALAFGDRELAQQKECLARLGRDPVGIAAAGVEIRDRRCGRSRGGGLRQEVLDLERTQRLVFTQLHDVHEFSAGMPIDYRQAPRVISSASPGYARSVSPIHGQMSKLFAPVPIPHASIATMTVPQIARNTLPTA